VRHNEERPSPVKHEDDEAIELAQPNVLNLASLYSFILIHFKCKFQRVTAASDPTSAWRID
jgi:hypothetical protein